MRIVVAGTGSVATNNYLPFLSAQPDVTLAVVNRTRDAAVAAADTFGAELLDDLDAVADWNADVGFVLTKEHAHRDTGAALIAAGVPRVFFEKPLVAAAGQERVTEQDFEDARSLLAAATDGGTQTAMMFNYRHLPHVRRARAIAAERDLGAVEHVEVTTHYACWSHCIDLIGQVVGPIAVVSAVEGGVRPDGGAADLAVSLRSTAGAAITLVGTQQLAWRHPLFEFAVSYERGRVLLRDLDGRVEVFDGDRDGSEVFDPTGPGDRWDRYRESFVSALEDYLASVRADTAAPVPGEAGLHELQVEAAMRRSVRLGRSVDVEDEFPLA